MMLGIVVFLIIYECYSQSPCTLPGFNFQPITHTSWSTTWLPPNSNQPETITFAPCSSGVPTGCGSQGPPTNQCYETPDCCAVCQSWQTQSGPNGACLGLSSAFQNITQVSQYQAKITYGRGDLVQTTPRQVDVYISCNPSSGLLSFDNFVEPQPLNPPPPTYIFSLYVSSSVICPHSSSCVLDGYHFNYIAAVQNLSSSWTPPGTTDSQTISYAPCSSGIPSGCGTAGLPDNQCTNKANCCAVCESWRGSNGLMGACLGLSSQLMSVTAISNIGVKITYGSGDKAMGTERRVDVVILCDPKAELLTFVDFIPPEPENPPPPFYEYVLVLSSSELCGPRENIEKFLEKFLP